jgi:hypothetical protein
LLPPGSLDPFEQLADCERHGAPSLLLGFQLTTAGGRDLVDARATVVVGHHPPRLDEPRFLQAMKRGVQRSLFDAQGVRGHCLDVRRDGVPMERSAPKEDLEYEATFPRLNERDAPTWTLRGDEHE